jgi:glycosyltransferase involved in cell wall biosynthesis
MNSNTSIETSKETVVVVMPAYNAAMTLRKTVEDIPKGYVNEIILVDDGSQDNTVEIARELGLSVFTHQDNHGYGANQKTCYRLALEKNADYIVMIHPDYQYDSRLLPVAIEILKLNICDVVLGCRVRTRKECLKGGMPVYKYLANRFLTIVENITLGQNLGEFHSGFRAYARKVLETIPFYRNSDDFVFDAQFLIQAIQFGFTLGDIPMPVRYFKEASSIDFWNSVAYGIRSLETILVLYLHRLGLIKSALFTFPTKIEKK